MKKLIVNADDFGYTRGVNLGIIRGCQQGIVTSTTLMANGNAFEDAVACAKANPQLGVGVHLVLVGGRCVAKPQEIRSLADAEGNLPASLGDLLRKLWAGSIEPNEIACELRAQIRRVIEAGIEPTHVDCHKHTHLQPQVMGQVAAVAGEFGIRRVRRPYEEFGTLFAFAAKGRASLRRVAAASLAHSTVAKFRRIAAARNFRTPDHFLGVAATGTLDRGALLSMISSIGEGVTELMCHPGVCDAELEQSATRLKRQREVELEALTDPAVREGLKRQDIELIGYRGLE